MLCDYSLDIQDSEAALDQTVRLLILRLSEIPRDRAQLEETLLQIITSIRRILAARFRCQELAQEAADSVCRTLLRRIRDCELVFEGTSAIEQFLIQTAFTKARSLQSQSGWSLHGDPGDHRSGSEPQIVEIEREAERRQLTQMMKRFLRDLLERMNPYLKNKRHREIFTYLLQGTYVGPRLSHRAISRRVQCSERTVERVQQIFEQHWRPLAEHARQEFQTYVARLDLETR